MKYLLLLATFAVAEKQIKLEDIEHDNLLNERRVNRDEETVKNGETQHLLAPIFVGPSNEVRSIFMIAFRKLNELSEDFDNDHCNLMV